MPIYPATRATPGNAVANLQSQYVLAKSNLTRPLHCVLEHFSDSDIKVKDLARKAMTCPSCDLTCKDGVWHGTG